MPAATPEFLDQADVEYMCLTHPPAYTAQELAHHVKIAGDRIVKTVIIELDGKMPCWSCLQPGVSAGIVVTDSGYRFR